MVIRDVWDSKAKKTYVFEETSYYDKEKKYSTKKRKMLGHRCPETGAILPNRPRKKKSETKEPLSTGAQVLKEVKTLTRKRFGASYFLHQAAKKVGLIEDVKRIFPNDFENIMSLAYYLVLAPTNSMKQFEDWQVTNYLPFDGADTLTSQRISDLFKTITEDDKQRFFNARSERVSKGEYWYYDTTSISSYSKTLSAVQWGHNKEDDKLPQLNLGVVYGEKTKLPIMYRYLNGNTPDSKTLPWLMSLLDCLPYEKIRLVMDRGFYSEANVYELIDSKIGFIMGCKRNLSYVKEALAGIYDDMESFENLSPVQKLYGVRVRVDYFKPESGNSSYPMQLYVYYDKGRAMEEQLRLDETLLKLYGELTSGDRKPGNESSYKKYFESEDIDGAVHYHLKRDVVSEEKRSSGYFMLLSSYKKDVWDVLDIYRNKEVIEDNFHNLKDRTNMRRLRVSSEMSLDGKIFVQFIALILCAFIKKELERTQLNKEYTHDKLIATLNQIDILSHKEYGTTVSEVTKAQTRIFTAMGLKELE